MFTRTENGAEVEMTIVEKPVNGAVEQADGVFRVKDGAEVQVWGNSGSDSDYFGTNLMYREGKPTNSCVYSQPKYGMETCIMMSDDEEYQDIRYIAEGTFVDATISFDIRGAGDGTLETTIGTVEVIAIASDGTTANSGTFDIKSGVASSLEHTFSGTLTEIHIAIDGYYTDDGEYNMFFLGNVTIDGKEFITDSACDYDNRDLSTVNMATSVDYSLFSTDSSATQCEGTFANYIRGLGDRIELNAYEWYQSNGVKAYELTFDIMLETSVTSLTVLFDYEVVNGISETIPTVTAKYYDNTYNSFYNLVSMTNTDGVYNASKQYSNGNGISGVRISIQFNTQTMYSYTPENINIILKNIYINGHQYGYISDIYYDDDGNVVVE